VAAIKKNVFSLFPMVVRRLFGLVRRYPIIVAPFIGVAVFEGMALTVWFLAPRPPLSMALAPIIRAFWGEQFLHYPTNFLLLPKIFEYTRNVLTFITGIFFSGIALSMLLQASQSQQPEWFLGIGRVARRYFRLFIIWGVVFGLSAACGKALSHYAGLFPSLRWFLSAEFAATIAVQLLFVFAFPAIVIENKKTFMSLIRSLALIRLYPLTSFLIVFIPSLLVLPVIYVQLRLPELMRTVAPEAALWALILRIALVTVVDCAVTLGAGMLLIIHRENEQAGGPQ
jgi:hypothetical protein